MPPTARPALPNKRGSGTAGASLEQETAEHLGTKDPACSGQHQKRHGDHGAQHELRPHATERDQPGHPKTSEQGLDADDFDPGATKTSDNGTPGETLTRSPRCTRAPERKGSQQ